MSSLPTETPSFFVLPDLHALTPFPASFNPHYPVVSAESLAWIASFPNVFLDAKRAAFTQGVGELLCAHAYPYADRERLRTLCDFIGMLFVIDEISDDQDEVGARKTGSALYEVMKNIEYDDGTTLCKMSKE